MDGLLSLLFFAALFYVMMRFGCGAHMVHGRSGQGRSGGKRGTADPRHVDPVCSKSVPPEEGYGKMHEGELYRFCSRRCLDDFEADPQHFTEKHKALST